MGRKLTQEDFIGKAKAVHGDEYDYSKTVYSYSNKNVTITCKIHGDFQQTPNNHLAGTRCKLCADAVKKSTRKTTDSFINRVSIVHSNSYDYSRVVYETTKTKVVVICPTHGEFLITPDHHLKGKGCKTCAFKKNGDRCRKSIEEFVKDGTAVHKGLYSYNNVIYKTSNEKVEITCSLHGSFWQSPCNHLAGKGCPSCMKSGYRISRLGSFYVLKSESVFKVGITNRAVKTRMKETTNVSGMNFTITLDAMFMDGTVPPKVEKEVLSLLKTVCKPIKAKFDGSTECFIADESFNEVLALINNIINKYDTRVYVQSKRNLP